MFFNFSCYYGDDDGYDPQGQWGPHMAGSFSRRKVAAKQEQAAERNDGDDGDDDDSDDDD